MRKAVESMSPQALVDAGAVAEAMEAIRSGVETLQALTPSPISELPQSQAARLARRVIEERRLREAVFPGELSSDRAWELLLALYVAREEDKPLRSGQACEAAHLPPTSALRLLEKLEEAGLTHRRTAGPKAVVVELTDEGADKMRRLLSRLSALRRGGRLGVLVGAAYDPLRTFPARAIGGHADQG